MKYKLVIFDFDGTIADTSLGIIDSHIYALNMMGKAIPSSDELKKIIGGNLLDTYKNNFNFDEDTAKVAVKIYRERYAAVGIHKAFPYAGIETFLKKLKECGCKIGLATLKADSFVRIMLNEINLINFFDYIYGVDLNDGQSKSQLLCECIKASNLNKKDCVLIGDSNNDLIGAKEAEIDFIAVTYGFGFSAEDNLKDAVLKTDSFDTILEYLKTDNE